MSMWTRPPTPQNEAERLRSLKLYRVMDTGAEAAFDDLTRLAAAICGTPISLISLIDEHRQWFKSRVGVDATHTSRDVSFCGHAIVKNEVFIVDDALKDPRFADNPLVTADPSIRFYAGMPLVMGDGSALGTLCVIDREARQLSDMQIGALKVLSQAVVTQLELRRALEDFRAIEQVLPMCSWCRSIRTPQGAWHSLDAYIQQAVHVTHGICPGCERSFGV